jgi:predicted AAA+ superfamily ATPase
MKNLFEACKPRDSVFDAARRDTVADLGDLTAGRLDARAFFAENYVTEGMKFCSRKVFAGSKVDRNRAFSC